MKRLNWRKVLAACMCFVMLFSLAACGGKDQGAGNSGGENQNNSSDEGGQQEDGGADEAAKKIAVVFATGGLGDLTYNDSLYAGVEEACARFGLEFDYSEPMEAAEYEPLLRGYAETGEYALIISLGFSQASSLEAVAPNYPDQNFMLIDGVLEGFDNIASYTWRQNEVWYLVGILCGNMTETKTVGLVCHFDNSSTSMNAAGLITGLHAVDPEIEVLIDYVGSYEDITGCKEMALAMNQKGADIVAHCASLGGLGVIEAGKEQGFYTMGWDGNVNSSAPDTNIASSIRSFPAAAGHAIEAAINGTFQGGIVSLGAKEDALYVTNEGSNVQVPQEIWDAVDEAYEGIKSGEISVPNTKEAAMK